MKRVHLREKGCNVKRYEKAPRDGGVNNKIIRRFST
jgi:hypothetical protein